jgi:hypothetical protein
MVPTQQMVRTPKLVSKGVQVIYDPKNDLLEHCRFLNKEIEDEDLLKIALQEFHLNNCEDFLGVSLAELSALDRPVMVVKNDASTYEEMLLNCFEPEPSDSKRIIIKG